MVLLFKLWVLCCCISSYKFFIVPFQAIGFAFCVSLLHFELGVTILLLFVLHMSCVTTIPKKNWNQSIKFSFLFHPLITLTFFYGIVYEHCVQQLL
jgi:hypothetical protein